MGIRYRVNMHYDDISINDVYPHMTEAELEEAAANLRRYVDVVSRIYERSVAAGMPWPEPVDPEQLTKPSESPIVLEERSTLV